MKKNHSSMLVFCLAVLVLLSFVSAIGFTYAKYSNTFTSEKFNLKIDITDSNSKTAFAILDQKKTLHIFNRIVNLQQFPSEFVLDSGDKVTGTRYSLPTQTDSSISSYLTVKKQIEKVVVEDDFAPASLYEFFYECENVVEMDLRKLDTSKATTMCRMFRNCKKLSSNVFNNWSIDTTSATSLEDMFRGVDGGNFTSVPSTAFKRDPVSEDKPLKTYNVASMFRGCGWLTSIDLTGLKILPNDPDNPVRLYGMFWYCQRATSILLPSTEITHIYFSENAGGLHRGLAEMFMNCWVLPSIDLSCIAGQAYSFNQTFVNCYALTTITVSDKFIASTVHLKDNAFENCYELKGGNGTVCSDDASEYARIDGLNGKAGYFTLKTSA